MYEVIEQAKTNLVRNVRALGAFEDIGTLPRKGHEGPSGKMTMFCIWIRV